MHPFLKEVRKRPGMYFGDPTQPFTRLLAFMDGYSVGYEMGRKGDSSWPSAFLPSDFDDFVSRKFRYCAGY